MFSVKWSDFAMERMREQAQYIAEQSGSAEIAWQWANDVFSAADGLADFPSMGRCIPEFPDAPYREIIVRKNFRLIYRQAQEVCYIVTVRRCSMLLDELAMAEFNSVE